MSLSGHPLEYTSLENDTRSSVQGESVMDVNNEWYCESILYNKNFKHPKKNSYF